MNKIAIIICLLTFRISCRNSISERIDKRKVELIDSVFSRIKLPEMTEYDLREFLDVHARKWVSLNKEFPVDSAFYKAFIKKNKILGYWEDYQKFYYVGTIEYLKKKYLAISQWIGNGDECYIYLLNFENGKIDKLLMIAKMFKSPDDFDCMKSIFQDGNIIRTTTRSSSSYSDSIIEKFDIRNYSRIY